MSSCDPPWITPLVKLPVKELRKELLIGATLTKRRTCHQRSTSSLEKIGKTWDRNGAPGKFALVEESG